jgi:hypothetical protein
MPTRASTDTAPPTNNGTSYWNIVWAGGGGAGVVPQQVAANTRIQVGEFQAIVTHSS